MRTRHELDVSAAEQTSQIQNITNIQFQIKWTHLDNNIRITKSMADTQELEMFPGQTQSPTLFSTLD